jgi:hypothetical protein
MSQYQRREDLTGIPDLLGLAAKEGSAFMAFHHSIIPWNVRTESFRGNTAS